MIKCSWFICIVTVACVVCLTGIYILGSNKRRPHIVIIIGDDMGWNDFGLHGSNQIPTPNIDALGYNGVILDRFYTQHLCSPSRAALMTGNYPIRLGLQGTPIANGENRSLPYDIPTLPEKLRELGYRTHLVGKWHLGAATRHQTPTGRGFETHFGYWTGFCGYFDYFSAQSLPDGSRFNGFDLHDGFKPQWALQGQYATELFTKKAKEVIENHNTDEPLFLVLGHLAAHTGKDGVELGVPNITRTNEKFGYIGDPMRRRYADLVNIVDSSVGSVVKKLQEKNMLENSVVMFLSDNGPQTVGRYQNYGSAWPFRGLKHTLLEGGIRGTAVIWSSLLEFKGYINQELIHISDLMPTLYHLAGGNAENLRKIDGINQWPTISENQKSRRSEILLNIDEAQNFSGLLDYGGRYKLIKGSYREDAIDYDQYYGEPGRGRENPKYNTTEIIKSNVNTAIRNLNIQEGLVEEKIILTRQRLDRAGCRPENYAPYIDFEKTLGLFDLFKDPCETKNIINHERDIAKYMTKKLNNYFTQIVPQRNEPVDLNSNPALYNNTWCTWLDRDLCFAS